jgi:hypothetical protein
MTIIAKKSGGAIKRHMDGRKAAVSFNDNENSAYNLEMRASTSRDAQLIV